MQELFNRFFALEGTQYASLPLFLTSLGIGLLLGIERERLAMTHAGIRTFSLATMFGTLSGLVASVSGLAWMPALGLLAIVLFMMSVTWLPGASRENADVPTQIALVFAYFLGLLVWHKYTDIAVGLAIITTAVLYLKPELSGFAKRLSRRDLLSLLQFGVVSLIILPILPNHGFGPYQALNPYNTWLMVVLIAGLGWAGYAAVTVVGERAGAPVLGFFGGLVSSTATSMTYARQVRNQPDTLPFAATVILLANLVLFLRLLGIAAVIAPATLGSLVPVMLSGFLSGLIYVGVYAAKTFRNTGSSNLELNNPTEMRTALIFGVVYAVVMLATAWLSDLFGQSGVFLVALVSGITDLDAIALSSFNMFNSGRLSVFDVALAVAIAIASNSAFKFSLIVSLGGKELARICAPMFLISAIAMFAAAFIWK